jgi:hypothetical protein
MYDLLKDPHQERNIYHEAASGVVEELHGRLAAAYACGAKGGAPSDCI